MSGTSSSLYVTVVTIALMFVYSVSAASLSRSRHDNDGLRKSIGAVSAEMLYSKVKRTKTDGGSPWRPPPSVSIRNSPPSTITVTYHDSIKLECEAGGSPPPQIHWLKDGQRINAESSQEDLVESIMVSEDHTINSLSAASSGSKGRQESLGLTLTRSRLVLDCITSRDVGRYTCVAENPFQRVSVDSDVTLQNGAATRGPGTAQCSTESLQTSGRLLPRIEMWTHTMLEFIGNDVKLFCRAVGFPEPEVTWIGPKDNPLVNDLRFQVLSNGDLIINNLSWKDMGSYTCVAENSAGSDSVSTFLYPTLYE